MFNCDDARERERFVLALVQHLELAAFTPGEILYQPGDNAMSMCGEMTAPQTLLKRVDQFTNPSRAQLSHSSRAPRSVVCAVVARSAHR